VASNALTDLRKLKTKDREEILLKQGMPLSEIRKNHRWNQVRGDSHMSSTFLKERWGQ
jgi:hypothetical protein